MKMKNKKVEEAKQRAKRKEERKARKRRAAPSLTRNEPEKEIKQKILIVCEGENTEPSYFEQFKLSTATVKCIGKGYNTLSLIEQTRKLSEVKEYDQVWCVFDKDDFTAQNFNNAIYKAEGLGFKVAYSNQAFEYWLILHFEDHQGGAMHRNLYCKKLNQYLESLGTAYNCDNKGISDTFFEIMLAKDSQTGVSRQAIAIKRAKRNLEQISEGNPAKEESSTTVYKLVEELNKYL